MKAKTVSFYTLGCRLNIAETGTISDEFVRNNFQILPFGEMADVTVINTCTVTDSADSTCRNIIRKARKHSPDGKIVVIGCYAQMEPEHLAKNLEVDLVLGTSDKYRILDYLEHEQKIHTNVSEEFVGAVTTKSDSHTRAFLKIQDGCNYFCSYCIIPFARGRARSISLDLAKENAKKAVSDGFKEIVLTGVNMGTFKTAQGESLTDLFKMLLSIEGLERLRISSIEPNTINEELLQLLSSSPKFMDHFHIPLQSGDATILKAMKRKYKLEDFKNTVDIIKKYFPNCSIGTDVIVGFPGDNSETFQNTKKFLDELDLTHHHIFPYSIRKGTLASKLPNHVAKKDKKAMVSELLSLAEIKLNQFVKSQIGVESNVLFETQDADGYWEGFTTNYLKVSVKSDVNLKNCIRKVKLTSLEGSRLLGQIL